MIAVAVILAFLVVIAYVKVGITVLWNNALTLRLMIGPFRFTLSPGKRQSSGPKDKSNTPGRKSSRKREKKSPWLQVLLSNWEELLCFAGRVLRTPVLNPLVLKVTFGGEDPAESALNYGRAWAAIGAIMPLAENSFRIGRREIDVEYDRTASGISVYAKVSLSLRFGQCVRLVVSALILVLRFYRQMKQSEKAVQM